MQLSINSISFNGNFMKGKAVRHVKKELKTELTKQIPSKVLVASAAGIVTGGVVSEQLSKESEQQKIDISIQDEMIRSAIENVKKEGKCIYISQLAEQTGLSKNQIAKAIYCRDNGLKEAFAEVNAQKQINADSDIDSTNVDKVLSVLQDAKKEDKIITIDKIAEQSGLTRNQVLRVIYYSNNDVRRLFNEVKGGKRKPLVTSKNMSSAQDIVSSSIGYNAYNPQISDAERGYIPYLSKQLRVMKLDDGSEAVLKNGFMEFPAFADSLISIPNDKTGRRLYGIKNKKNIKLLFDLYRINPELTERLLFETDLDGQRKYTYKQVVDIVRVAAISEKLIPLAIEQGQFVIDLLSIKRKDGTAYYGVNDITKLAELNKKMPKLSKLLIYDKNSDNNPRFNVEQIENIINLYFEEPELVTKKLVFKRKKNDKTQYQYSAGCIDAIIQTFKQKNPEKINLVRRLLDGDKTALRCNYNGDDSISSKNIVETLKIYDARKELLNKIDNENTTFEKFKKDFQEKYGKTGTEIIHKLVQLQFSYKEIVRILYLTETGSDVELKNIF